MVRLLFSGLVAVLCSTASAAPLTDSFLAERSPLTDSSTATVSQVQKVPPRCGIVSNMQCDADMGKLLGMNRGVAEKMHCMGYFFYMGGEGSPVLCTLCQLTNDKNGAAWACRALRSCRSCYA